MYNEIDHKTHFMSGATSYMFRHQDQVNTEIRVTNVPMYFSI